MPVNSGSRRDSPVVSIVVVTHNNAEIVGACLDSATSSTARYPFELIVVDNASSDTTRVEVERVRSPVSLICLPRNVGFARAVNVAAERAKGRYIVLVNSDAFLDRGCVDALVGTLEDRPRVGIVGAKLRYPSGRLQPSAGTFPSLAGSLWVALCLHRMPLISRLGIGYYANKRLYRAARRVDWVTAAVCAARIELTPLPAASFMYGEDVEWARCVREAGYEVWLQPLATAVHVGRASVDLSRDADFAQRSRAQFELRWFARRKYGARAAARVILVIHAVVRLVAWGLPALLARGRRRPLTEQLALLRAAVTPSRDTRE